MNSSMLVAALACLISYVNATTAKLTYKASSSGLTISFTNMVITPYNNAYYCLTVPATYNTGTPTFEAYIKNDNGMPLADLEVDFLPTQQYIGNVAGSTNACTGLAASVVCNPTQVASWPNSYSNAMYQTHYLHSKVFSASSGTSLTTGINKVCFSFGDNANDVNYASGGMYYGKKVVVTHIFAGNITLHNVAITSSSSLPSEVTFEIEDPEPENQIPEEEESKDSLSSEDKDEESESSESKVVDVKKAVEPKAQSKSNSQSVKAAVTKDIKPKQTNLRSKSSDSVSVTKNVKSIDLLKQSV